MEDGRKKGGREERRWKGRNQERREGLRERSNRTASCYNGKRLNGDGVKVWCRLPCRLPSIIKFNYIDLWLSHPSSRE